MHARFDPNLASMMQSDARDFCNAAVCDERRKPDIKSDVRRSFQAAAGGTFTSRNPNQIHPRQLLVSASAFREVTIPCRKNPYLLRQKCSIKATRSASIPVEAEPSLQYSFGPEKVWLDRSLHMGGFLYETPPGLDSKRIQCQDEISYPEQTLDIIEGLRHAQEPRSPGPSFVLFAIHFGQIHFSHAQAH